MSNKFITQRVSLYRGDCMDIMRRIRTSSIDAIIVDPPYGVAWQSSIRTNKFPRLPNDAQPFIWWLHDAFRVCRPTGCIACFCQGNKQQPFRDAIETAGFKIRSQVIWDRNNHSMGDLRRQFAPQHDIIWFASKDGFAFPHGRPRSVLRFQKVLGTRLEHPTQKPVALMRHLVHYLVPSGGRVLDPCMGSGSTGVAAVHCGCRFTGIELERRWYAVAKRRIVRAMKERRRGRDATTSTDSNSR